MTDEGASIQCKSDHGTWDKDLRGETAEAVMGTPAAVETSETWDQGVPAEAAGIIATLEEMTDRSHAPWKITAAAAPVAVGSMDTVVTGVAACKTLILVVVVVAGPPLPVDILTITEEGNNTCLDLEGHRLRQISMTTVATSTTAAGRVAAITVVGGGGGSVTSARRIGMTAPLTCPAIEGGTLGAAAIMVETATVALVLEVAAMGLVVAVLVLVAVTPVAVGTMVTIVGAILEAGDAAVIRLLETTVAVAVGHREILGGLFVVVAAENTTEMAVAAAVAMDLATAAVASRGAGSPPAVSTTTVAGEAAATSTAERPTWEEAALVLI
jgi:hypothetical protein